MYFSKKVYAVYNGVWGKAPEAWEFSRIFVLQSVRLLLTVSYRKKNWGAGCTICFPNNFVGGTTAPSAPPVPAPMPSKGKCGLIPGHFCQLRSVIS